MGIASIVLGIVALLFAMIAFLVSFVPVVGSYPGMFFSFSAPVLALIGIVLGGVAMSRAREEGMEGGTATAGLVISVIAFFPALLVAMTCGLCNTMCASGSFDQDDTAGSAPVWWMIDAGAATSPGMGATPPTYPLPQPASDPPPDPPDPPSGHPPPAFPPPPMDPAAGAQAPP